MTIEKKLDQLQLDKELNENKSENSQSPFLFQPLKKSNEIKIIKSMNLEIFSAYSILYRFIPEKQELKERGIGDLTIELIKEKNLYRLRMIRKQIESYACNHYIEPSSNLTKHEINKNTFIWTTTTDLCDPIIGEDNDESQVIEITDGQDWKKDAKKSPQQTFICRFKTEEISSEFVKMFEKARYHNERVLKGESIDDPQQEIEKEVSKEKNDIKVKETKEEDIKEEDIKEKDIKEEDIKEKETSEGDIKLKESLNKKDN